MNLLVKRLHDSAMREPAADALVHAGARLSYATLWSQVQAIAAFLQNRRLPPQARVALLLENSASYVAAYYGVLAAGGVAVALNTAAKATDLINWLAHSETSWLFLDTGHPEADAVAQWCRGKIELVAVAGKRSGAIQWDDVLGTPAEGAAGMATNERQLAAIIYTSGTTGRPKGVMLSHGNLAHNVASILAYLGLRASDRTLNVLPFYYSYGNSVLHTHLAAGACVVIENNFVYPHTILERMQAERVTGFVGVPSTYALLLSRAKTGDYDLTALRYLTQAGGPMPPTTTRRLMQAFPQARLFVMYGQTEATARLSYVPPERLDAKLGSIGISIPGVTLEIRGDHGQAAPLEVGEIWARGANVMLGYWRDPEATAGVLCDGWLKTGDMGYRDEDGYFYIEGRKTDMIKTGAHRVHPKEIEEVLAELTAVREVAVIGVPDPILGQVIKACIVADPGEPLDLMRVKAHCRERLATYKIPKHIEIVAQLPKTASGKIQRFLLASSGT